MSKVIKSEIVQAYCQKHKMCDHVEYTKQDGTKRYVCRLCKGERIWEYPIYGRRYPNIKLRNTDIQNTHYGRQVA